MPPELALEASQPVTPSTYDDEASAVKVYPDRRRLARVALLGFGAWGLSGGIAYLIYQHPELSMGGGLAIIGFTVLSAAFGIPTVNALLLLVRPRPLLVLSQAGIKRRGTALVRWREIIG